MRTISCFRVTTLLPLLSLALTADGGVHEILEKAACLHHPLSLTNVCGSDQLVLRRLTLARAGILDGIADCAVEIERNFSARNNAALLARLCCRIKAGDCRVPTDLPSQNRSVLKEFAGFVDKCRAGGASQCDLTNVTKQGTVPLSDVGKSCGLLSYVSVGYSCVRGKDVVSFGGADFNQTFPDGNVTLISNNVTSARCLLYSSVCDVTVGVGMLDADPQASCSLELSDGSRTANFSCSSPQLYNSWNRTFFSSTSNHVTITVNLSPPSPRALWLTAEVLPGGVPLNVLCGQAASSVLLPVCPTTTPSAGVVLTSSTAPSTSTALPSTAPVAVGWTAFNVTDKVVCKSFPLVLSDSCADSHSLVLRAITLGRSADSFCATATRLDLLDSSVRDKCCRHRPDDKYVTYHLPSDRDNLPSPYKELAEKCFQTPEHCDLNGMPGVNFGQIPEGVIPNQGLLTYVAVSYSCIPKNATLSFTEDRNVTAPVVSLRLDKNTPVSSQCLIYSHSCDVTIKLGIIEVNVSDPCPLTLDDGSPVSESCSRLQTQPQPLLQSSSNAVAVFLHFSDSGVDRQRLWLEAEGSDKSLITVVCGASAPAPASARCTPATTSSTTAASPSIAPNKTAAPNTPANTAARNTAATTPLHADTPAGTTRETSTNVHSGTTTVAAEQTTHAGSSGLALPTYAVGVTAGAGGLVLVAVLLLGVFLCKRKPRGDVSKNIDGQQQRTSREEDTADTGYTRPVFGAETGKTAQPPTPIGPAWNPAFRHETERTGQRHNQLPPISVPDQKLWNPPGMGRAGQRYDYAKVNKPKEAHGNFEIAPDYDDVDRDTDSRPVQHEEDSTPVGRDNFVLRSLPFGDAGVHSNPLFSGEDAVDVGPSRHPAPDAVFPPGAPRSPQTGVVIPRPRLGYEDITLEEGRPAPWAGDVPPWVRGQPKGQQPRPEPEASNAQQPRPEPEARAAKSPPHFGQRVMPEESGPRKKLVSPQGGRRPTYAADGGLASAAPPLHTHDLPLNDHFTQSHGLWTESPRRPDPWQGAKVKAPFGSSLSQQKNWILGGDGAMDNAIYMEGKGVYSRGAAQPGGRVQY